MSVVDEKFREFSEDFACRRAEGDFHWKRRHQSARAGHGGGKREKRKRCTDIHVYLVSVDAEVTLLCVYKAAEIRGVFGARRETIARERERERADGAGRK